MTSGRVLSMVASYVAERTGSSLSAQQLQRLQAAVTMRVGARSDSAA